ncbi:TPA: 30S ribosomal protein S4 [Candidatus Nomurabacteria bacterium]|nr:MAG: 30S ribosomal protein S4 [Parcubacteria bacterium RAAC4_OD1_1]HCY26505.1 30S ribosomal protein S4 [Candidatus Nomurabacteria bacterium]
MKKVQKYKICRRLGPGVFEKCQNTKFVVSEGKHAKNKKNKKPKVLSGYGLQFIEKQKVRFMYGLSEKQFSNYVKDSVAKKGVSSTEYLFELLEYRLDNIVYRLGIASTRRLARQLVSHGHILVNNKKITVPSMHVRIGDTISVRPQSSKSSLFSDMANKLKDYTCPNWLKFNIDSLSGIVEGKPKNVEGFIDLNTVLEFYSR